MLSRRDRDVKVQVLLIAITGLDVIFYVHCVSVLI